MAEYGDFQNLELGLLMTRQIRQAGGRLRFDQYMDEHLFGVEGYYARRVRIGPTTYFTEDGFNFSDFDTDASDPDFVQLVFTYLNQFRLAGGDFVELGGGNGIFKQHYLALSPGANYTSVDRSPKLADSQKMVDGKVAYVTNATSLPFPSDSIQGVVFANELLDALPCRILRVEKTDAQVPFIPEEGYVSIGEEGLEFGFAPVDRDEFIEDYETYLQYLANSGRSIQAGDIDSIAPSVGDLFREVVRVMKPGSKTLFFDYGIASRYVTMKREAEETPYYFQRGFGGGIEQMLYAPYETDITYSVDFDHCAWMASKQGMVLTIKYGPAHHLFKETLKRNPISDLSPGSELLSPKRRVGFLELSKSRSLF